MAAGAVLSTEPLNAVHDCREPLAVRQRRPGRDEPPADDLAVPESYRGQLSDPPPLRSRESARWPHRLHRPQDAIPRVEQGQAAVAIQRRQLWDQQGRPRPRCRRVHETPPCAGRSHSSAMRPTVNQVSAAVGSGQAATLAEGGPRGHVSWGEEDPTASHTSIGHHRPRGLHPPWPHRGRARVHSPRRSPSAHHRIHREGADRWGLQPSVLNPTPTPPLPPPSPPPSILLPAQGMTKVSSTSWCGGGSANSRWLSSRSPPALLPTNKPRTRRTQCSRWRNGGHAWWSATGSGRPCPASLSRAAPGQRRPSKRAVSATCCLHPAGRPPPCGGLKVRQSRRRTETEMSKRRSTHDVIVVGARCAVGRRATAMLLARQGDDVVVLDSEPPSQRHPVAWSRATRPPRSSASLSSSPAGARPCSTSSPTRCR